MADAHQRNISTGATFASIDVGYTAPRNAKGGTMPAHGPDGGIVDMVHMRLTDNGCTHSQVPSHMHTS